MATIIKCYFRDLADQNLLILIERRNDKDPVSFLLLDHKNENGVKVNSDVVGNTGLEPVTSRM